MDSFTPLTFSAQKAKEKARRYTPEEWEQQKANVERLYVTENRPLREVINTLEQQFGFTASEKQLKSRLTKWDLDVKNLKGDTVLEIARTKAKRAAMDNKKSSFRVNKNPVDDRKIDRFLQRYEISKDQLLAMASPVDVSSLPRRFALTYTFPRFPDVILGRPTTARKFSTGNDSGGREHNGRCSISKLFGWTTTHTGNVIATSSFERTIPSPDRLPSRGKALQEITRPVFDAPNDDAPEILHSSGETGPLDLENSGIDHVPRISTPPVRPLPTGEEDAAARHSVSRNRLQIYQAKRDYSYARQSQDRIEGYAYELVWSCDFCCEDGGYAHNGVESLDFVLYCFATIFMIKNSEMLIR
ncbi:hypothetical protein NA56DRAFT_658274 [Hyaloscypha hepaticicola]|uniref:Clr5 domain-containing protein n=1 Tax=Hyaloscypha hepaticicola TaxID=2082293 RepID=A0A2J6Q7X9_9HELO|nr:hypothetical protein NA56DRAFT_658274 [Hyaloscypha hepaticicola]